MNTNDIQTGLRVVSQIPLDQKLYFANETALSNLGSNNNLAFTYYQGMQVYCVTEKTRYEWVDTAVTAGPYLMPSNFTYPANLVVNDITYSNKSYNFKLVATGAIGSQGPQGVAGPTGPQGVPGPVGPAGLIWKFTWNAATAYLVNDAVGYSGASYYRIVAGTTATAPNLDTTNWALLSSQGAIGPQGATGLQGPTGATGPAGVDGSVGVQGPPGPQGLQGPQGETGEVDLTLTVLNMTAKDVLGTIDTITSDIAYITSSTANDSGIALPTIDLFNGQEILVSNVVNSPKSVKIVSTFGIIKDRGFLYGPNPYVKIKSGENFKFIYAGGYWTVQRLPNTGSFSGRRSYTTVATGSVGSTPSSIITAEISKVPTLASPSNFLGVEECNVLGQELLIENSSTVNSLNIKFLNNSRRLLDTGFTTNSDLVIAPLTTVRLTMIDNAISGSEYIYNVEFISRVPVAVATSTVVKTKKTTITAAEVLQLFTTPIEVLDAPLVGTVRQPISIYIVRNAGTAYTLADPTFEFKNQLGLALATVNVSTPLGGTTVGHVDCTNFITSANSGVVGNTSYKLEATVGNPTLGTGNLDVYVTYNEITL